MSIERYLLSGLFWFLLSLSGCSTDPEAEREGKRGPDLLQTARDRGIGGPSDRNIFFYTFTRGGVRREALVLVPGAVFEARPEELGERGSLRLWVGMPFQMGDGAELIVEAISGGKPAEIARLTVNPVRKREDRQWRRLEVALPAATERVRLRVLPGPSGDGTADWLGLAPLQDR